MSPTLTLRVGTAGRWGVQSLRDQRGQVIEARCELIDDPEQLEDLESWTDGSPFGPRSGSSFDHA